MEQALKDYIFKAFPILLPVRLDCRLRPEAATASLFKGVTGSDRVVHLRRPEKDFDRRDGRGL